MRRNKRKILILLLCYSALSCAITIRHKHFKPSTSLSRPLGGQTFDFTYSGDVAHLPGLLHQYDTDLTILPALGQKKSLSINVDLAGIHLSDINDAVNNQTNHQVSLIYDSNANSLRLNYISVLDTGTDAARESLKWQNGGTPKPVLQADGIVRFPYGEYQPVISCQPLNLCDIELQAGEDIQGIVIGDSARWNEGDQGIPVVYSGSNASFTPHLVLKPDQGGLETTLMITTSKRTYMIRLKSSATGYVARAGFYYPGEMIQKFTDKKALLQNARVNSSGTIATNPDITMPLINLSKVNYKYTIEGSNYPWKPTQVFDDGISVYIQMPPEVSSQSLPGVCIIPDGESNTKHCEMVNFRYNDHFYIIDKLFNQARLINGFGDTMQTITIQREAKPGFWARLFGAS